MQRRSFIQSTSAGLTVPPSGEAAPHATPNTTLTAVEGVRVGHFTDSRRPTGCSVILFDGGAVAGVDVRGAAPGTRETDLLDPVNTVQKVNGIVLTGGSAYGLDAAGGVMRYLAEHGEGFHLGPAVVPIVPAAVLFDLGVGDWKIRPDATAGYRACEAASTHPVEEGSVGAGAGATIGKMFGPKFAMKGGIGSASLTIGETGIVVAALIAVNAVGDVVDSHTGQIVAGARSDDGKGFRDSIAQMRQGHGALAQPGGNTTIGIIATNAAFDKASITKIAQMAHDGMARAIRPVHTPFDGDTLFAAATGRSAVKASVGAVGAMAAEVVAEAIVRAVKAAKGLPDLPGVADLATH